MNEQRRLLSTMAIVLLFAAHYASGNFFWHTHSGDGSVIAHSHPMKSASHTMSDIRTLDYLTGFSTDESIVMGQDVRVFRPLTYTIQEHSTTAKQSAQIVRHHLRAPPAHRSI